MFIKYVSFKYITKYKSKYKMEQKIKRGEYGKNMIRFTIKFWTNDLPKNSDNRTAWGSGVITLLKNEYKDLKPDMIFFKNLEEFTEKFQKLIDKNKITLIEKKGIIKKKFK